MMSDQILESETLSSALTNPSARRFQGEETATIQAKNNKLKKSLTISLPCELNAFMLAQII